MVSKREFNKIEVSNRILAAARILILEQDSSDFSMPQLAESAKVALATPYKHFDSKAGVLNALLKQIMAGEASRIGDEIEPAANSIDGVLQFATGEVKRLVEFESLTRPIISGLVRLNGGTMFAISREWVGPWHTQVNAALNEGLVHSFVDPELVARCLQTAFFGTAIKWLSSEINSDQFEADARYNTTTILLGVASDLGEPLLRHRFSEAQQALSQALAKGEKGKPAEDVLPTSSEAQQSAPRTA